MSGSSEQLMKMLQLHKVDFIIDTSHNTSIYNNLKIKHIKEFDTIFISNQKRKNERR